MKISTNLEIRKHMLYVGVDGCKGGWLVIALKSDDYEVRFLYTIENIWQLFNKAKLILIDIPIGLRDRSTNERFCDKEARKRLGHRRSSVFRAPCRPATKVDNYEEAKRINRYNSGKSLSTQTWALVPKIKELDTFMKRNKAAKRVIRETHPEVCFWALNNYESMENNKKKPNGFEERVRVLEKCHPRTKSIIQDALNQRSNHIARDDILDALAAAITASKEARGLATLPDKPERDSLGLIKEADMILAMSCLGVKDVFYLIDAAKKIGVQRMNVIHPNNFSSLMTVEQMKIAADKGAWIELTSAYFYPPISFSWDVFMEAYKAVGADRMIVGTDVGVFDSWRPTAALRHLITGMLTRGVPDSDVEKMIKVNPTELIYP